MVDIDEALEMQSNQARQRQNEIKRLIFLSWAYMIIVSAIFTFALYNMSSTNSDLAEVINRRSPVLEYLRCHDDLEDKKSQAQTELLLTFINDRDNPSEATQINFDEAVLNYDIASKSY
jgi:hypothetical protein